MSTQIKITDLSSISNANLTTTTIFPGVNMVGTPITQKVTLHQIGNFLLAGTGVNFPPAAIANTAYGVLGSVANIRILGGNNQQVLTTDGAGNLSWATPVGGGGNGIANGASNISIPIVDGNIIFTSNAVSAMTVSSNSVVIGSGSGGNITGAVLVNASTLSSTTLSVSGNAVTGNISSTNGVFTNISGNGSGLTNITGANVTGEVANATFATTAGTVTTAAQPNITSVGTLTSLSVTGNAAAGNISSTNGVFTNISGNGSGLTDIQGANISGSVATATTATTVDITNTNGLSTLFYPTFVEDRITGQIVRADVDLTYRTDTNTLTMVNLAVNSNATVGNLNTTQLSAAGTANINNLVLNKFNENVVSNNSVSGTITPNVAGGTIFNYTLTGNITLNELANVVAGSSATLIITQDSVGNRLLTSTMKFAGNIRTLSTAANAVDIMGVFYDGSTYYASLTNGFE